MATGLGRLRASWAAGIGAVGVGVARVGAAGASSAFAEAGSGASVVRAEMTKDAMSSAGTTRPERRALVWARDSCDRRLMASLPRRSARSPPETGWTYGRLEGAWTGQYTTFSPTRRPTPFTSTVSLQVSPNWSTTSRASRPLL